MRKSSSLCPKSYWTGFMHAMLIMVIILCHVAAAPANGREAKILRLSDSGTAEVVISGRGTVLSFPTKPTKVILGKANSFGVEYVDSDLAISPLSPTARSHLFVYMAGRRFSFDLVTSMNDPSAVILVRDAKESAAEVRRR